MSLIWFTTKLVNPFFLSNAHLQDYYSTCGIVLVIPFYPIISLFVQLVVFNLVFLLTKRVTVDDLLYCIKFFYIAYMVSHLL